MAGNLPDFPMQLGCVKIEHSKHGACFMCCQYCNAELHESPSCGDSITHNGLDPSNDSHHPCINMELSYEPRKEM